MSRYLITGASGLLGLNLSLLLCDRHEVTGVMLRNELAGVPFSARSVDLGVPGEGARLMDAVQPDVLIHCAALANIDECESQPDVARRVNAELPGELAAEAHWRGVKMVYISTDAVFDGSRGEYTEEDAPNPLSIYARTKLDGEISVQTANPGAIVARVNFFGWSLLGKRSLAEWFYNNLAENKPMKGFSDVYFCSIFVGDLCRTLVKMVEKDLSGLYHTVSSGHMSKYEFGRSIARQFGLDETLVQPCLVADGGLKAARSPNLTLSTAKLAAALGEPLPGQTEGIRSFYEQYLNGYRARLQGYAAGR